MPGKPNLNDRVESLEKDVTEIKENQFTTLDLAKVVNNLKRSIEGGHFCKWNTEIGTFIEFKKSTPKFVGSLQRRIDKHDELIEALASNVTSLTTGKKLMHDIHTDQKQVKKQLKEDRFRLYLALGTILLTVLAGRIFEWVWFVMLGHR